MKNAVVAALCSRRTSAHAASCGQKPDAAGVQAAEHRRAERLGERHAEAGRADDRDGLEHRRRARAEAEPGAAPLGHAGERHAAGERDPEAAGGRGAGREEGDDADVRRARPPLRAAPGAAGRSPWRDRSGSGSRRPR